MNARASSIKRVLPALLYLIVAAPPPPPPPPPPHAGCPDANADYLAERNFIADRVSITNCRRDQHVCANSLRHSIVDAHRIGADQHTPRDDSVL